MGKLLVLFPFLQVSLFAGVPFCRTMVLFFSKTEEIKDGISIKRDY